MVLIKNIQMPYKCDMCRFKDDTHNECRAAWKRLSRYVERKPEWCPLIEVEQYGPEGTLYKEK